MKKATIISGKRASGKSWISKAIINQYHIERVLQIESHVILKYINTKMISEFKRTLFDNYDLIVIESCRDLEEIKKMSWVLLTDRIGTDFLNNNTKIIECTYSMVFLTQSIVKPSEANNFHVINCNNDTL